MKMDQNGHHFAWAQVSCSLALLPCGKLHNFPLRSKLQPKIIDSTKQFEYTHGVNPKIQREIFVYIRGTKRASHPSDPPAELCRNLPLNFGIYIVLFTPFHLNQTDLLS